MTSLIINSWNTWWRGICPRCWPFVRGIHQWPMDSLYIGSVTLSFDLSFGISLNKLLNNQTNCRRFGTPWRWHNVTIIHTICIMFCCALFWFGDMIIFECILRVTFIHTSHTSQSFFIGITTNVWCPLPPAPMSSLKSCGATPIKSNKV